MELLTEQLLAAAADPPPSRIDLDALIAGERRRRRNMAAGGVAAAVLALAVAVPLMLGYGGTPAPGTEVSTPAPEDPAGRLTATLDAQLRKFLPDAAFTNLSFDGVPGTYKALVDIQDGSGTGHLSVIVVTGGSDLECPTCVVLTDGTRVDVVTDNNGQAMSRQVTVERPNGTLVALSTDNFQPDPSIPPEQYKTGPPPPMTVTRPKPPLTTDELLLIGLALSDNA
ncbi:MAG TPA: hypothetical protein VFC00_15940 [Micromonosporaceae bacterium]|nr:hypothetical protein [Micromonosporaceae bacterium]